MPTKKYKIVRFFALGDRHIIAENLSLNDAIAHCHDLESSSRTCTIRDLRKLTMIAGEWFDGFTEQSKELF
jgi:hypothetical protein